MESSRRARGCLCVGLVLLLNTRVRSQENNSSITTIPVPSDKVSNHSTYYNQVEFINDFLLSNAENSTKTPSNFTMPPSNNILESTVTLSSKSNLGGYSTNQDNGDTTSSRDNNTTTNELQVIPINSVPAAFSSVIDTLPVHPRIPRRSVAKRKTRVRLNRHSTRVNPNVPVRFLLPPPINKHKCSGHSLSPDPPFKIKPIVISSSTPLIPISAVATPNENVVMTKPLQLKSEQKESPLINMPPKRRVFVPPPPRHLLPPPFSQENNFNHYYTTPQNVLPERNSVEPFSPQNNAYESSTKPQHDCDKSNRIESSSVIPIVVVEDIREINNWNSPSSPLPPVNSSPHNEPVRNVELINDKEPIRNIQSFNDIPPAKYNNQFLASTTSENPPVHGKPNVLHPEHNNAYETKLCDKNHSITDNRPLHSPNNPQQFDLNNQPLSANNQIFSQNYHDISQNNKKPFIQNIPPQIYTPNNQQPFLNSQPQSSPNRVAPNDQHNFNPDYQQLLLSADKHQTISTKNPHEFVSSNVESLHNHELAQNEPLCNESHHQEFPSDTHYNSQQFPLDNNNNQQFDPNHKYVQQQFSLENEYNHKQISNDNQYGQQQLTPNSQYNQQHFSTDNQYNKQKFPSENFYNQQQLNPNRLNNQQQFPSEIQYNQHHVNPDNLEQYDPNNQYHQLRDGDQHNFSPSDQTQFSQTAATQTSVTRELGPFSSFKSSPFEKYSTTPLPLSSSIEPFPILRGPNIEQALFDTGNFQVDHISFNDTDDSTVAMMNRPLLTQEVARMGMKITANLKVKQINKAKLNRGQHKYNHLNQFNFPDLDVPSRSNEVSGSSKLLVAETSYYKDRRGVQEQTETADLSVIPGTPGLDYPTLNRPPLKSDFSCRSVENHRGYVADPSTRCQVFYICVGSGPGEAMLCPNGTLFSQDYLVCDWWFNIDCQPYS